MPDDAMHDDWSQAFAALPQETPPAQGWGRVSARLDRVDRPVAAVGRAYKWAAFAAAAALVLSVTLWERREPRNPAPVEPSHARLTKIVEPTEAAKSDPGPIAASAAPTKAAPTKTSPAKAEPSMARLYTLYAESARLEALLAYARDDRVASAGAALLADELEAQVAGIDAALVQPGLDDAARTLLWQARVDALRQAAGFESTQRLLASQGRSDAMLVSVD